ncbi:hypothetical protein AG1IA_09026 [Rhizoctonia solani AG-1 IA]|uniref:Uncharacterized protein n=1 Tax=Thanatephorus cucumeris (strain AG1-IA) TaxID=983506 RepID=L8WKQ2_THACA|nr:hypothetical protein AG1IA_09026 [Rhizoctonia solani AG-1 IA]
MSRCPMIDRRVKRGCQSAAGKASADQPTECLNDTRSDAMAFNPDAELNLIELYYATENTKYLAGNVSLCCTSMRDARNYPAGSQICLELTLVIWSNHVSCQQNMGSHNACRFVPMLRHIEHTVNCSVADAGQCGASHEKSRGFDTIDVQADPSSMDQVVVWSIVCSRLILSGRSWYDKSHDSYSGLEMSTLPRLNPPDEGSSWAICKEEGRSPDLDP